MAMIRIDIPRDQDAHAIFRRMVEHGAADQAVEVAHHGKHCLTYRILHEAALLTVLEEPKLRLAAWTPHPRTEVGQRMQALLDKRAAYRAAKRAQP